MKKTSFLTAAFLTAAIILSAPSALADDISVVVNGETIQTEVPPVIVDSRTMVPLRAVCEALGCDVSWNAETRGITLTDGKSLYFTWIDRDHAFKTSGVALEGSMVMDVPPVIMDSRTMVPLRAISELFGAQVNWDDTSRTVTVDYAKADAQEGLAAEFAEYEEAFDAMYDQYKGYVDGMGNKINAEIQLEGGGVIALELYPDIAPVSVRNFVSLANEKHYDGKIFHRVIKDFMIQGGGFDVNMQQHASETIHGEFPANGWFNMIPHERGMLSMARTSQSMDSASNQFFIMHADYPSLNGQYAVFGKVTSGMEYVDAIASAQTKTIEELGMDDVPVEPQVIKTIVIK